MLLTICKPSFLSGDLHPIFFSQKSADGRKRFLVSVGEVCAIRVSLSGISLNVVLSFSLFKTLSPYPFRFFFFFFFLRTQKNEEGKLLTRKDARIGSPPPPQKRLEKLPSFFSRFPLFRLEVYQRGFCLSLPREGRRLKTVVLRCFFLIPPFFFESFPCSFEGNFLGLS